MAPMIVMAEDQAEKLEHLKGLFAEAFGTGSLAAGAVFASAPGRMEVAGNHVDHQGGRVISAAIGERTWGIASPNGTNLIRVSMEGFGTEEIDLGESGWDVPRKVERQEPGALVRGMAAAFAARGGRPSGFDMVTCSDVPPGCGLSSSAAFEVMVGACLEGMFGDAPATSDGSLAVDAVTLALDGVDAEQRFFGKPCGAQDQLASACGGAVLLDFSAAVPAVEPLELAVEESGYCAVLIDSRQDHSLHNDEFAAIPADMRMVANALGAPRLGDLSVEALLTRIGEVRAEMGDRRVMRALHYFDEVERVDAQRDALASGDFGMFLRCVRLSGASSAQFLQNVSLRDPGSETRQPAMVIQSLCAHLLGERGAWRIHGGGFGGSVLAFVPLDEVASFMATMDELLGYEACRAVSAGAPGVRVQRLL